MIRTRPGRQISAALLTTLVLQAGGLPFFSGMALAADAGPRVVVLPLVNGEKVPERANVRFRELLEGELRGRDTLTVADVPKAALEPAPARPSAGPSAEVLRALEEGHQQLGELAFEPAATALRSGIAGMVAAPESIDFEKLVEAHVALAVALFRMGDEDAAQAALLTVARLDGQYRLPDGKYPPIFVREFDKARRRAEKAVKGTIVVDGPPGATAFVDGRDLGMVPVTQDSLVAGTHYVKVEGTRGELFGQSVEVRSGTSRVKAAFKGGGAAQVAALPALGPVLDAEAVTQASQALDSARADFGVVGVVYRSGDHQLTVAAAVFSARQKGFVAVKTYTVDQELLTANVEAFKLADEVADLVEEFRRPSALPLDLMKDAPGYKASAVASADRPQQVEVARPGSRKALQHSDRPPLVPREKPEPEQSEPEVRALTGANFSGDQAAPAVPPGGIGQVKSGGAAWWVWTLVGVGVVAAAGGAYYGVTEVSRPVTGTVTAKW